MKKEQILKTGAAEAHVVQPVADGHLQLRSPVRMGRVQTASLDAVVMEILQDAPVTPTVSGGQEVSVC